MTLLVINVNVLIDYIIVDQVTRECNCTGCNYNACRSNIQNQLWRFTLNGIRFFVLILWLLNKTWQNSYNPSLFAGNQQ